MAEIVGKIPLAVLQFRKLAHDYNERLRRNYLAKKRREEEDQRRIDSGKFNRPHLRGRKEE